MVSRLRVLAVDSTDLDMILIGNLLEVSHSCAKFGQSDVDRGSKSCAKIGRA